MDNRLFCRIYQLCAALLPEVLESYGDVIAFSMARIADELGICGRDDMEKKDNLIHHIKELNKSIGIPEKIDRLQEDDIEEIARRACAEANPAYPVPKILNRIQLENVIRKKL